MRSSIASAGSTSTVFAINAWAVARAACPTTAVVRTRWVHKAVQASARKRTVQESARKRTQGTQAPTDQPVKKPKPVYKKWWFWAIVAVSAYVVYSIASEGSNSNVARSLEQPMPAGPAAGGVSLFRF